MKEVSQRVLDLIPKNGLRLSGSQVKATLDLGDEEYKEAKTELKALGLVVLGRGRSGTIAVAEIDPDAPDALPDIAKMGASASAQLWAEVESRIKHHGCKCGLAPNMTYEELIELEEGCRGSRVVGFPGWVCPVLDYYRGKLYKYRIKKDEEFDEETYID